MLDANTHKTPGRHRLFTSEGRPSLLFPSLFFFFPRDTQPKNQLGFKWVRFQHHHTSCSRVSWHVKMQTFLLIWTDFPCMQGILRCPNRGKGLEYTVYTYQEFLTFHQCTELKYEVFGAHLIQLQLTGSLSKWSDFTPGGIRRLIWFITIVRISEDPYSPYSLYITSDSNLQENEKNLYFIVLLLSWFEWWRVQSMPLLLSFLAW